MNQSDDLPLPFRDLFKVSGPVLQYRLLRDVVGEDDSYHRTARLADTVAKLPEVRQLVAAQNSSGDWGGTLGGKTSGGRPNTEFAFLRLCELGTDRNAALENCLEHMLLPALNAGVAKWEFEGLAVNNEEQELLEQIQRDKILRLICRARLEDEHYAWLKPIMTRTLAEWDRFGNQQQGPVPTRDAYAALSWFPWSENELPGVRRVVIRALEAIEVSPPLDERAAKLLGPYSMRLLDKGEYLSRPARFFEELELTARLGITRDVPVGRWLLEELEAHQDADGWFRFETGSEPETSWYFPLEATSPDLYDIEWSFRAALVFKLLEYDV